MPGNSLHAREHFFPRGLIHDERQVGKQAFFESLPGFTDAY